MPDTPAFHIDVNGKAAQDRGPGVRQECVFLDDTDESATFRQEQASGANASAQTVCRLRAMTEA